MVAIALSTLLVIIVEATRRLGLGIWGVSGIVCVLVVISIGVIAGALPEMKTFSLAAPMGGAAQNAAVAERILADVPWTGTGAGSYQDLYRVYREADDAVSASPSAAVQIAVELGKPALVACSLGALVLGFWLLVGALRRGRNSFYPLAGASCVLLLLIIAYVSPGPLGLASSVFEGCVIGLGLAQSKSRVVT